MKRITTIILLICTISAFGQSDTTAIRSLINSNFPDNTSNYITPARLRTVSLELMRSSANLAEENTFLESISVEDSIKSDVGFYVWNGVAYEEIIGGGDTANWAISGGFISPVDFTNKLNVDTARFAGNIYPDGSGVNIGRSGAKFDTVFANVFDGVDVQYWDVVADTLSPILDVDLVRVSKGDTTLFGVGSDTLDFGVVSLPVDGVWSYVKSGDWVAYDIASGTMNAKEFINFSTGASIGYGLQVANIAFGYTTNVIAATPQNSINLSIDTLGNYILNYLDSVRVTLSDTGLVLSASKVHVTARADGNGDFSVEGKVTADTVFANVIDKTYGEMGFRDSSYTVALTIDVPTWVTNDGNDLWSQAATNLRGVTYDGDSLVVNRSGMYYVTGHISVSGSNGDVLRAYVERNGTPLCLCSPVVSLTTNHITNLHFATDVSSISSGDVLKVFVENIGTSNDVAAISGKLSIYRID